MSTIRAATLSNVAGTGSPSIAGGELSRARFNLNGTGTIAARDSFNIASFTDNGTGNYTANFSTAFPNVDYAHAGAAATGSGGFINSGSAASRLTSSMQFFTVYPSDTAGTTAPRDYDTVTMAIFGDIP